MNNLKVENMRWLQVTDFLGRVLHLKWCSLSAWDSFRFMQWAEEQATQGHRRALVWNISSFRPNGYALLYFLWSKPFTGSCPGGLHLHIELQWLRSDSLMATVGWFNGYWFTIFDIPRIVKLDGCMQRVTDNQPFSWSSPRTIGAPCRHSPTPTVYLQKNILNRSF